MTQQECDLTYWAGVRNTASNFADWYYAQMRRDALFRAMGYGVAKWAEVVDRELIFPRIRAAFEGEA